MSEHSYLKKVQMGLTGPEACLPVCYPTAFDRLSEYEVKTQTYMAYMGAVAIDETTILKSKKNSLMTVAMDMIAVDVGLDSWRDLGFDNITNRRSFAKMLRHMVKQGYGVILDVDTATEADLAAMDQTKVYKPEDDPHAVGLISLDDQGEVFRLKSSWLPKHMKGPQTAHNIYEQLVHQTCPSWNVFPFHDANVTFFPHV
jgi:hypothetical protein